LHLWLTTDNGATWTNLSPDPSQFWAFAGGEVEIHPVPRAPDGTYFLSVKQGVVKSIDGGHSWSLIPNSGGSTVGLVIGDGYLFASDQWTANYRKAPVADTTQWQTIPPPAGLPPNQGAPYLDYDSAHHILYSSNFMGGFWRVVKP
jgi:hypothetical protein